MSRLFFSLVALCALVLTGCESPKLDHSQRAKITGDWVNPDNGARMSIFADGAFVLTIGETTVQGTLTRGGDEVAISYLVPATLCQGSSGLYRYARFGNKLVFEQVNEPCPERAWQILQPWIADGERNQTRLEATGSQTITDSQSETDSQTITDTEDDTRPKRGKGKPGQKPFLDLRK